MDKLALVNELFAGVHKHLELACTNRNEFLKECILLTIEVICKLSRLGGAGTDESAIRHQHVEGVSDTDQNLVSSEVEIAW